MNPRKPIIGDVIIWRPFGIAKNRWLAGVVTFIHEDGSVGFDFAANGKHFACVSGVKQGTLSDTAKGAPGTWRWPKPGEVKFPFFKVTRRRDGKGYLFKPRKRRPAA